MIDILVYVLRIDISLSVSPEQVGGEHLPFHHLTPCICTEQFLALQSHNPDMEKSYYESLLIVLDTLEKCLSGPAKDTTRFDEALNVKLLLREICQFVCMYQSLGGEEGSAAPVCFHLKT